MMDKLVSAELDSLGNVNVLRKREEGNWRCAVPVHDINALDRYAHDLSPDSRAAIIDAWSAIPLVEHDGTI